MAKHGIIGGGAAAGGAKDSVVAAWRDSLARTGRETDLGTDLCFGLSVHIAETEEKAIGEARPFSEENMKMFAPLGFVPGLTGEQIVATADPRKARSAGLPTLKDAVEAGAWLCGPPDLIVEKLMALQGQYPGLQRVNVGSVVGTPQSVVTEQLQRLEKR